MTEITPVTYIVTEHTKKLNTHPAYLLARKFLREVEDNNWARIQNMDISYEAEAIIAIDKLNGDRVVGFMGFELTKWNNTYSVNGAYVVEDMRKQGIHQKLFAALADRAKANNIVSIFTTVHKDNVASLAAMKSENRELESHNFVFHIADWIKG